MVPAGLQTRREQLDVQEVVLAHGAQQVLDDALGAGVEEVAELGGVSIWGTRWVSYQCPDQVPG